MIPNSHKIMVAGGRELMFKDEQYDIFKYGANSIVIGDYLTTSGNSVNGDIEAIEKLNFTIAEYCNK